MRKKDYADRKPIGVYPMTNWGGIEILAIEDYEFVFYRFNFGEPQEVHRSRLKFGEKVTSFKTYAGYSIRLDDCIKL